MGDELLAKHGDATSNLQPSLSFVTTIVFNDVRKKTFKRKKKKRKKRT